MQENKEITEFEKMMKKFVRKFAKDRIASIYGQFILDGTTYFTLLEFYDALVAAKRIEAVSDEIILEYCEV